MEMNLFEIIQKYKAAFEKEENIIQKCADLVNNGVESRKVDCEIVYDWETNIKTLTRLDTQEELWETKIEPSERQTKIKLVK